MKKAVIATGGKQYVVAEGDKLDVELLKTDKKTVTFEPLLVTDEKTTTVGKPIVATAKATAEILAVDEKQDKVTSIRYKAKKRVRTVRGHRQRPLLSKLQK